MLCHQLGVWIIRWNFSFFFLFFFAKFLKYFLLTLKHIRTYILFIPKIVRVVIVFFVLLLVSYLLFRYNVNMFICTYVCMHVCFVTICLYYYHHLHSLVWLVWLAWLLVRNAVVYIIRWCWCCFFFIFPSYVRMYVL